jgi:thiamine biosynthesis lipoprotein
MLTFGLKAIVCADSLKRSPLLPGASLNRRRGWKLSLFYILIRTAVIFAMLNRAGAPQADTTLHKQARKIMGTFCEVQIYDADSERADKAIAAALGEMERVDGFLSNYAAASELSAVNREASRSPVHVSRELFLFFTLCRTFHEQTMSAFDPTVGPLVRAWGFFTAHPAKPSDADIAAARAKSGFDKIVLNGKDGTVFYRVAGMEMDPGGIGKGYAVDRAVDVLNKLGVRSALVSAGGSTLFAVGHPPGRDSWRIAIKNPLDSEHPYAIVRLKNASLSTSGVSEKSVQVGSHRYSHIFDPRTGAPVEGVCQASVVAATATESDALTKAVFILPQDAVNRLFKNRKATHALKVEGGCDEPSSLWITPWSSAIFMLGDRARNERKAKAISSEPLRPRSPQRRQHALPGGLNITLRPLCY